MSNSQQSACVAGVGYSLALIGLAVGVPFETVGGWGIMALVWTGLVAFFQSKGQ